MNKSPLLVKITYILVSTSHAMCWPFKYFWSALGGEVTSVCMCVCVFLDTRPLLLWYRQSIFLQCPPGCLNYFWMSESTSRYSVDLTIKTIRHLVYIFNQDICEVHQPVETPVRIPRQCVWMYTLCAQMSRQASPLKYWLSSPKTVCLEVSTICLDIKIVCPAALKAHFHVYDNDRGILLIFNMWHKTWSLSVPCWQLVGIAVPILYFLHSTILNAIPVNLQQPHHSICLGGSTNLTSTEYWQPWHMS